jgi:sigma54-dependent transcription regulator
VDEKTAPASGCGIDKSLRFIQELEKTLNIRLLDRMQVAWRGSGEILTASLSSFETLLKSGKIAPDIHVFNNLIERKSQLEREWSVPVTQSWHSRYLPV